MRTPEVASVVGTSTILARKWAIENEVTKDRFGYWWTSTDLERFKSRNTKRGPKRAKKV